MRLETSSGRSNNTKISLTVNGQPRQSSTLGKLIWSVPEVIAHVSTYWALQPGDLIFTGTPEGVGSVEIGDALSAQVDGLGGLEVVVIAA